MMRAWFQKPWVSISLLLVAAGIVYANVLQPLFFSQTPASTTDSLQEMAVGTGLTASESLPEPPATIVNWEKVKQSVLNHGGAMHNPFRPTNVEHAVSYDYKSANRSHVRHALSHHLKKVPLRLRAIVIGAGLRHALINDRIMQVGEAIQGMRIIQINESSVVVVSNKGSSIHLQLDAVDKGSR